MTYINLSFDERYRKDGSVLGIIVCPELPAGMGATYTIDPDGRTVVMTKANGKGSIRYRLADDSGDAMNIIRKWATRKIQESRRGN